MTVKQLKKELEKLGKEFDKVQIVMSGDCIGNFYRSLSGVELDGYCKNGEDRYIDTLYFDHHGFKGNCFDTQEEWEEFKKKKSKKVIVLFPE